MVSREYLFGMDGFEGYYTNLKVRFNIFSIIHPIHRFKSSDWVKEGNMTWINFDNVHIRKPIHVCSSVLVFTISLTLREAVTMVTAGEFGTFTLRYGLQNL